MADLTLAAPGAITIVHDSAKAALQLADLLAAEAVEILTYSSAEDFLAQATEVPRGCVVAPADLGGIGIHRLLDALRTRALPLRAVVLVHTGDVAAAASLMRAGARDVVDADAPRRLCTAVHDALADCTS